MDALQSGLFHREVGFDVEMGGSRVFVAKPQAMTVMSTPDWSRCIAVVWRNVWGGSGVWPARGIVATLS